MYLPQSKLLSTLAGFTEYQDASQKISPLLLLEHYPQVIDSENYQPDHTCIQLQSGLQSIGEKQCELWVAEGEWEQGVIDLSSEAELSFSFNEQFLIGSLSIPLVSGSSLQNISQLYYERIIDFIQTQNKPHLLRMWNYFPKINQSDSSESGFLERYQQFCIGRHNAFASSVEKEFKYPAASAVGSCSDTYSETKMVILFIATHESGRFLENPDQISAYQYPNHYSPKSPSFARASIFQTENHQQLYISGTASIVGHESQFSGDVINQTHQTIRNLKRLIEHSNGDCINDKAICDEVFSLASSSVGAPIIKVYLRNPDDKEKVAPIIEDFSPDSEYICYLQADVCRQELDIEIEMLLNRRSS